jgi:N-acetyl sugar amidotransferase
MKSRGRGRDYDCLIGVSGGVDSTYVAYLTKKYGLRPLAVHLDNGWNSELAVKNIELTLSRLGIDLYTEVLDWTEFRDLQLSFLKASTTDMEIPTDHAILAVLWKQALSHDIKYIISGMNFATESTFVPSWVYGHWDWRYIKGVQRKFGSRSLKTFPHFTLFDLFQTHVLRGVRSISILNYVDYNKEAAMQTLSDELGWQYYGGKHYESVYTRFIQGYILPEKFGVDKRYGHLSDVVRSGQMTRERALVEIEKPPYPGDLFAKDYSFLLKKFGISSEDFQKIMAAPVRTYRHYDTSEALMNGLRRAIALARSAGLYPR